MAVATSACRKDSMDPSDVVLSSVKLVVTSEDFKIPSSGAVKAIETASQLISWCSEEVNQKEFSEFSSLLVNKLQTCFNKKHSITLREELMWQAYHTLRISNSFKEEWNKFLRESIGQTAIPTFFQFVSHQVFRKLIKNHHQVISKDKASPAPITIEEENALRYVAGHVCRKVQAQIKKSSLVEKEDMILFITELSGDEMDEERGTEAWTNAIDRGGLWHISDDTYLIFYLMEDEIRHHLTITSVKELNEGTKDKILDAVLKNEDLCFQWSLLSSTIDDSVGKDILQRIAKLYLTIRGFAFATSFLEIYKQQHKKKIQKSKALRRKLVTPTTDHD